MGVADLRRLRQFEEENRNLKMLVADLSLDDDILQKVLAKKVESRRASGPWWWISGALTSSG